MRTFALPQLLYVSSVLYVPEWVFQEVDNIFFDFLWSGKKTHVKKSVIVLNIEDGGLKMPLFEGMVRGIKCTWVKRILSPHYKKHKLLSHFMRYGNLDVNGILTSKLDIKYIKTYSGFYEQVLKYWFDIYSKEPIHPSDIMSLPIWNNKHILIGNKPAFLKDWFEGGIKVAVTP